MSRPRLQRRLDRRAALTVVRAPAGFGKTTLIGQHVRGLDRAQRTVAWVTVRPAAGNPTEFWIGLLDVLQDALAIGDAVVGGPHSTTDTVPRLAALAERALNHAQLPLDLVIDGFEHLEGDGADGVLLDLLRAAPDLRLIVCGRTHDRFTDRAISDIDADVITAGDLRFTSDETGQMLAEFDVDAPDLALLVQDAFSGWPALTRALALALRRRRPAPADVDAAVRKVLATYLWHDLLRPEARSAPLNFLLALSLPDDFTAELAAVLTEDPDTRTHLDRLQRDGLLLQSGAADAPLYRWPTAVRQGLSEQLQRRDRASLQTLHTRLGRWYLSRDAPIPALRHAVLAQRWLLVVRILDNYWRPLMFANAPELQDALLAIPLEHLTASPRALAVRDIRFHVPDDLLLQVAPLPADVTETDELVAEAEITDQLDTAAAVVHALRRRGAWKLALTHTDRLAQAAAAARARQPAEVAPVYPSILLHTGLTHLLADDLTGALTSLQLAYEYGDQYPRRFIVRDAAGKLALAYAVLGDSTAAHIWLARYASEPEPQTWLSALIRTTADTARLLLAVEALESDTADAVAASLPTPTRIEEFWAFVVFAQCQHLLTTGAGTDGLDQLDRARSTHPLWSGPGSTAGPLLAAAEADALIATGRANQAHQVIHGAHAGHPFLQVGAARLALLSGDPLAALRLATDRGWERRATPRDRRAMLLLHAVAAHRLGHRQPSLDTAALAATAIQASGNLRALTTVPRGDLAELGRAVHALDELLQRPEVRTARDIFPAELALIQLSGSEARVLERMGAGLTHKQIADSLVVSVNTVKTQVRSLYRKLGTESKAEAVARAREWGLLTEPARDEGTAPSGG